MRHRPACCGFPSTSALPHVPGLLSSFLSRTRASLLVLLVLVLPLHSVAQLVAGLQGGRHVHTTPAPQARADAPLSALTGPLRAMLDRLHAGHDPRLATPAPPWAASRGAGLGQHQHGGVFHTHGHDTHDVLDLGEALDEGPQGGATAFLAWLPAPLPMAVPGSERPTMADVEWRDRVVAPLRAPPRG